MFFRRGAAPGGTPRVARKTLHAYEATPRHTYGATWVLGVGACFSETGYLKAVWLEIFGPVFPGFLAEADPRDPHRSPGPAPHINLHEKSAPLTDSKAASRHQKTPPRCIRVPSEMLSNVESPAQKIPCENARRKRGTLVLAPRPSVNYRRLSER